jgi:hypothetical protein
MMTRWSSNAQSRGIYPESYLLRQIGAIAIPSSTVPTVDRVSPLFRTFPTIVPKRPWLLSPCARTVDQESGWRQWKAG